MDYIASIAPIHFIKTGMLIAILIIGAIIIFYNWLYLVRMVSSFEDTDLSPPTQIGFLVKASIFTALFTVLLVLILLLTRFY